MELDEQLREAGERWRETQRAPVADFRRATRRSSRRSREPGRSRGLLAAPILIGAFLLAVAVVAVVNSTSSSQKVTVTQPTAPISAAPASPSVLMLRPDIVQTGGLAIDSATVWVTGYAPDEGPATLEHIDTKTGQVLGTVKLPDNSPFQIVVGDGAVWICSQQNEEAARLIKVDPATTKVTAVIPTQGDANVALTPDALWVAVNTGILERRDPDTNRVLATITMPGGPYSAHFVTAGPLGIFLASTYDGSVLRVDPVANTVTQIADLGDNAGPLVELDGSLWVRAGTGVVAIDPATGAITRRIARDVRDLASDGRSLWASTNGPTVLRIDPQTGAVTTRPLAHDVHFAIALAGDPATGAVWAASDPSSTRRLFRVSP
jgi:streptogramin lyase